MEACAYAMILFYDGKMFWTFYTKGGLTAKRGKEPLLGEKIVDAAGQGGNKVLHVLDGKLDD
jgi:hypothetical protein